MSFKRTTAFSAIFLVAIILAVTLSSSVCADTPMSPDAAAKWQEDLAYLSKEILANHTYLSKAPSERQKDAAHKITREQWERKASEINSAIPKMSESHAIAEMMKLIASICDAHTWIPPQYHPSLTNIPIYMQCYKDGTYVTRAEEGYKDYLGWRVDGIGNAKISDLYRKLSELIPCENGFRLKRILPGNIFNTPQFLFAQGITSDPDKAVYHFKTPTGEKKDVLLGSKAIVDLKSAVVGWATMLGETKVPFPLYMRNTNKPYWAEYLPDKKTIYFAYNQCIDSPDLPFATMLESISDMLKKNDVERIVVDLRLNGGGNSPVLWPFIDLIKNEPKLSKRGSVFCIIGSATFSSAMLNTMELRRKTNAILVGSPTGGKPNGYGGFKTLYLPNSKLMFTCTTRYFTCYPDDDPPAVMPDIKADITWKDYSHGVDPALEAIWRYKSKGK